MYTCPYCKQRALSPTRKMFLGPATKATCGSCQRKVSVSWWSLAPGIVAILIIAASLRFLPHAWSAPIAVLAFGAYSWAHLQCVPLVGRDA